MSAVINHGFVDEVPPLDRTNNAGTTNFMREITLTVGLAMAEPGRWLHLEMKPGAHSNLNTVANRIKAGKGNFAVGRWDVTVRDHVHLYVKFEGFAE